MLEVNNIDADIGPTQILRSVNLNVTAGSMCGLIGRNGAGKTTVMRTIMGLLTARNGTILLDGEDLVRIDGYKRAHLGIGYMPEDRRLLPQLTTEEHILFPVWATKADNSDSRLRWIFQLMPEVEEFRHRRGSELSGGQQKFVAFARALMAGVRLLLLDEPSEGIAPVFAKRMIEILQNLKAEGQAVLVSESNDVHIAHLLDRTFVIERGNIIENR